MEPTVVVKNEHILPPFVLFVYLKAKHFDTFWERNYYKAKFSRALRERRLSRLPHKQKTSEGDVGSDT